MIRYHLHMRYLSFPIFNIQRELGEGSIGDWEYSCCQDMKSIALQLHKHK